LGQSATTQGRGNRRAARGETGLFDMGSFSIWHWLVVAVIVMLMFGGRGRISEIMGDVARGIRSFRKGLSEEDKNLESTNKDQTEKKN
jgi:TatA/E family protein of Tat protein translocase